MFTIEVIDGQRHVIFDADVTTGEAYDITQTSDLIESGDVLVVSSEGVVGLMVAAWPTAIQVGAGGSGAFHTAADDDALDTVAEEYGIVEGLDAAARYVLQ